MRASYQSVRSVSGELCAPLETEDFVVQSMPDASPAKWHLAHTTWFFETFVLKAANENYQPFDMCYEYLFNSYYNAVGRQFYRPHRGLLSRPTVKNVLVYRQAIDDRILMFLDSMNDRDFMRFQPVIEIGLHHEQQHQELILTDLKHLLSMNPLEPCYTDRECAPAESPGALEWVEHSAEVYSIGHGGVGFAYDNESPRHRVFLEPFAIASRLITNDEYRGFIEDGGYERPELWLADGWNIVQQEKWHAPLYWRKRDGRWVHFTLAGLRDVDPHEPVCHVSYFEADAFARWKGARLATEAEWEVASRNANIEGNFVESKQFHPRAAPKPENDQPAQLFGDVWEWTGSAYLAYPGYSPPDGALGEYNGKFMCNQFVLRGGSCATSISHIRPTYRNFFPPAARWQFTGIRLARQA